jgi:fatty acyl-CoA reductase
VVESAGPGPRPGRSAIRDALAGRTVLLTGVTGFLGTAVLERLLAEFPGAHVVVLIRSRDGVAASARLHQEVLAGAAFEGLRRTHGTAGLRELVEERVTVVAGDVNDAVDLPPGIDVVIHCAATVSFDPSIDEAFRTNVDGALGLYRAVLATGAHPHLVHVSTAYVAGVAKGIVPEAPLGHDVDWPTELRAAYDARRTAEEASRRPEQLDHFVAEARRRHGRAGPMTVSADAEKRRGAWVHRRLVQYGRARAQTLGWPDVYTFTKALGERAVEELAAEHGVPLSIVRPSVVESALRHPHPGWIQGFKMAEPIILAYGRGAIPEFPGIPDAILDLIPVDLVVNALLAVAARPPADAHAYYHVCSGSRNQLSFWRLYELVRDYFRAHPLPERGRGTVRVPEWSFPGRRRVESRLRAGERLVDGVDAILTRLPATGRVRSWVRDLDRQRGRLEFVRRYADLYGAYTETEVIYTDPRTVELFASLPEADRRDFPFDAAQIDWRYYLQDVHCPAITVALRFPSPRRPDPAVRLVPRANGTLAVFDMEGTILDSNVVESYVWLRMAELPGWEWTSELGSLARRLPGYVRADRRDRAEFLRSFYRRYEGASVDGLARLIDEDVAELVLRRASAGAIRRIREHRAAGHRTVLITGAIEPFVRPLAPLFDEVVAARLGVDGGRFTGRLAAPPLVGEARAAWLRAFAAERGADLTQSHAYADSHSDLPLLRAVGNPVAVNPDIALYRVARSHRWPVESWKRANGTPRVLVPEGLPS